MSARKMAALLDGWDSTTVLEAASTVLSDIESDRFDVVAGRLDAEDGRVLKGWLSDRAGRAASADTPVHPLALLAATTLALGQSRPGPRDDAVREAIARNLTKVGLRYNQAVTGGGRTDPDSILGYMARSALWRAVENEDWMVLSAEVVRAFGATRQEQAVVEAFERVTGLTLQEWFFRSAGGRATRQAHGARSWGSADEVDPDLERAWRHSTAISVPDAVSAAAAGLTPAASGRAPQVADPFDLGWLASHLVVTTADGRRFSMWLGAMNRYLLPASIAQRLADITGLKYDLVASALGKAAERLLLASIEGALPILSETRIPESAMPASISKCDYLFDRAGLLVGIESTLLTPTRALSKGEPAAVEAIVARLVEKFHQIYSAFAWRDPARLKRWLPVVVLASPAVVEPLLNERVHQRLIESNVLPGTAHSEVMTCHMPEFLDLMQYADSRRMPLSTAVEAWRDSTYKGVALDWWLSDQNAYRSSGKRRIDTAFRDLASVLGRAV